MTEEKEKPKTPFDLVYEFLFPLKDNEKREQEKAEMKKKLKVIKGGKQ